jgi:uncharacterized protein YPO0396
MNPGFRLVRLEVRNWGTFDERVQVLDLAGSTALLIGENGSGKSTLVDALLTLLVPRNKRNYNLSAGGNKKRERDEYTYVLGAYGSENTDERAKPKFLRKPGASPAILLAYFRNEATGACLTITQLLWVQGEDVKKLLLTARSEKSIAGDFQDLQEAHTWKKALERRGFDVDTKFSTYAEKIVRYLGMESTTTLSLFSQTVAIKEITHVSGFIREHMLERLDSRELVERLERHYDDLTQCHDAIQRAQAKLDALRPIAEKARELRNLEGELAHGQQFQQALPALVAVALSGLLTESINFSEGQLTVLEQELQAAAKALDELTVNAASLKQALESDDVGRQLEKLRSDIEAANTELGRRTLVWEQYREVLRQLGVVEAEPQATRFADLVAWGQTEHEKQELVISDAAGKAAAANQRLEQVGTDVARIEAELGSLRSRVDLIPEDKRRLRQLIATATGVPVTELPFAGELIDVREEYSRDWRGALERLLRGFGLSMLVPESYYSQVNGFINNNNLRSRITYHRVPLGIGSIGRGADSGRVIEKLVLKEEHPLAGWVAAELRAQYNHRCCDTVQEFERVSGFAVTKRGLIRGGGTLHIKDDSRDLDDPVFHILGWSNLDKIRRLETQLEELNGQSEEEVAERDRQNGRRKSAQDRLKVTSHLASFRAFDELDWISSAQRKESLEQQREELQLSADHLRDLQTQLEQVKTAITETEQKKTELLERRGALISTRDSHAQQREDCEDIILSYSGEPLVSFEEDFRGMIAKQPQGLTTVTAGKLEVALTVANNATISDLQRRSGDVRVSVTRLMERFLNDFPEHRIDLTSEIVQLPEFMKLQQGIELDDLPRHEANFRDLMNRDVLTHVVSFQDALENHRDEMKTNIAHLNLTLKTIPYTTRTYISIRTMDTSDHEIQDFRSRLKACLEYGVNADRAGRELSFRRISDLISRIREKPEWATKVSDTRNWLRFAVEEKRHDDNVTENYYDDTAGGSGGQKAKLAFTILASAIAYQYRIAKDPKNKHSFRFVVIDEMFARTDETNSRYALQLFANFHLQLLIVCPFDARARVVEPFVSSYHIAVNPTTQSSSVRTITVEELNATLINRPAQHAHA